MEPAGPIPFYLVTGFLGGGKTTLLKRILHARADAMRLAVIQNEFAPGNVDGKELRQTGKPFEILEVGGGSVFCVCLLSDFVASLKQLIDQTEPEAVILEASGLSDPIAIAQLLEDARLEGRLFLAQVWTVVDATRFLTLEPTMVRVQHQIRIADTVIVNKTDEGSDQVPAIRERVAALNPFANVVEATYCDIPLTGQPGDPIGGTPVAVQQASANAAFESCGRPPVATCAARVSTPIPRGALDRFLADHEPLTYRMKGFVRIADSELALAVQSCFGNTEVTPVADYNGPSELVAMGPKLDVAGFRRAFTALADNMA